MALVQRYQKEFRAQAEFRRIQLTVRLNCSTFPQARRAVSSGYAALLPSTAFQDSELTHIQKLPLPFPLPAFEQEERSVSLVWNHRLETMMPRFEDFLEVLKSALSRKELSA